jgi:glycosyltransferase involved in cell wall biosynthesis
MQTDQRIAISVVVAVYKNEESIGPFLSRLEKSVAMHTSEFEFEILMVNDGTPDKSMEEVDRYIKDGTTLNIRKISLARNFGQMGAILAGMSLSKGQASLNISADLQDPPELLSEILNCYLAGNKVVICARQGRKDGLIERITSRVAYYLLGRGTYEIPRGGFDYFLLDKEVVEHLLALRGRFRFFQGDILGLGFSPVVLNYVREKRIYGKSSYTFSKRFQVFVDSIVDISYMPIKFVTRAGVLFSILGFLLGIGATLQYIFGSAPFNGFTAIFCSILLFGGFQILAIGLIGEYVFRIYDMNRKRPPYIIRD